MVAVPPIPASDVEEGIDHWFALHPFPEGSTLEQTGPEEWTLTTPGPTKEEIGDKVVVKLGPIEVDG
jgi:hypothetical protein